MVTKDCKHHGITEGVLEPRGYVRCKKCRVEAVNKRRLSLKKQAVEYKGGKCEDCGLVTDYLQVYEFHHKDPTQKDFAVSKNGHTRSWEKIQNELDKCDMLCANCHRIRHAIEYTGV